MWSEQVRGSVTTLRSWISAFVLTAAAATSCERTPPPPPLAPLLRLTDVGVRLEQGLPLRPSAHIALGDVSRPTLASSRMVGTEPECPPLDEAVKDTTTCALRLPRPARITPATILAPGFHRNRELARTRLRDLVAGPLPREAHYVVRAQGVRELPRVPWYDAYGLIAYPAPELDRRWALTSALEIPLGAELRFAIGVEEQAWSIDSAPVDFTIKATGGGESVDLFRKTLDPARKIEDRGWHEERVSLERVAGRKVFLELSTLPTDPADLRPQLPLWGDPTLWAPAKSKAEPSVVLISLDTLRARSLSALGHELETSPFLSELAQQGALFTRAFTTYSNTLGSHISMLTGLYPRTHRVIEVGSTLAKEKTTLAERLRSAGYDTAAFTEDGLLKAAAGAQRGFSRYTENREVHPGGGDSAGTFQHALDWVRQHRAETFFLFVHTYEVHAPYTPPPEYAHLFADSTPPGQPPSQQLQYERDIRYLDDQLRRFVGALDGLVPPEGLILVVTADHGEEFWEHGGVAHLKVYDEVMHVPLLFRYPGVVPAGLRIDTPVSLTDVVPTVLELGKIRSKGLPDGRSLVPLVQPNATGWGDRVVFAEAPPSAQNAGRRQFGARSATHKCIVHERDPGAACFDLRTDPKELFPLDPQHDAMTSALFAKLESYRTSGGKEKPAPLGASPVTEADAHREEKLRALGYIE